MEISDTEPPGNVISIPLLHYIPKNQENNYFYRNGLSKLIPRLTVKVHSNIEECFTLWEEFSPKKSLFDLWDFRFAWYQGYGYQPYFYTLYERQKPLGVLPLWYSKHRKKYLWFGSDWMEDNTFFVKDEKLIDVLFEIAPNPLLLNAIEVNSDWSKKKIFNQLKYDDPKNLKDISQVNSMDELLQSFDKKDRYNLKADYYRIEGLNPRVKVIKTNNDKHFDKLAKMNILRFSTRLDDESDLLDKDRLRTYRNIIKNSGVYKTQFVEIHIQKHLAAIDLVITYKDKYYMVKGGNDLDRFKGIGNFLLYYEFKEAIENGFSLVDCLQVDYGWKHRYFDQIPVYTLEK
ncbi:MAG: hypothetical protein HYW86_03685 [Candidatus Roizmanbacteria bacterium]|nr:MAG: hypothetical protein HYW86_03685 [Candidatus Roizmanbacteria bacterium]